jgi:hypothetical protein
MIADRCRIAADNGYKSVEQSMVEDLCGQSIATSKPHGCEAAPELDPRWFTADERTLALRSVLGATIGLADRWASVL